MVTALLRSSLREIRQSLGRYLAILAIVGLGVGFFAGLRTCQPAMLETGTAYIEAHRLYDFRVLSTLGFTREDVAELAALDGVSQARGAVYADFLTQLEGEEIVVKAHSLTEGVNTPEIVAGRMPQAADECVADARRFREEDLGTVLTVAENNSGDTKALLRCGSYTIVGLCRSPYYLNYDRGTGSIGSGSVSAFVYIPEEGFAFDAYYEVFLTITSPARAYSDAYREQIDGLTPAVEALAGTLADRRYDGLRAQTLDRLRDAEAELAGGWEEYRAQRADVERELADARQELRDGEDAYAGGKADYEQGRLDYAGGLREYQDAQEEIASGEQELRDAERQLAQSEQQLAGAQAELAAARQELDEGWAEYEQARRDAERELDGAYRQLQEGEAQYAVGLQTYRAGLAQAEDAEEELAEAERQLKETKAALDRAPEELAARQDQYEQAAAFYRQVSEAAGAAGLTVEQLLAAQPDLAEKWQEVERQLGAPLNSGTLDGIRAALDQARIDYEEGLAAYEEGLAEYEAGQAQLAASRRELDGARRELDDARAELDRLWQAYNDSAAQADAELDAARRKLTDGEDAYAGGVREYEDGLAQAEDARQEIAGGWAEIEASKAELADAERELNGAERELDGAQTELDAARRELDELWQAYDGGAAEAEAQFAGAEQELADAEREIADGYAELEDLKEASTYVLSREENTGYASFDNDTSIVAAISLVFPVFFFLVAALVCMTTMKRMVDEQRTQIGVLKALGYGGGRIMGKYLFYSGSAAAVGSVAGYAIGSTALPWVMWEIYGVLYGFAPLRQVFVPQLAAVSLSAALLCSTGATYFSCRAELKRPAAELIRPKAPKAGRRVLLEYIGPLWRRLSFLHKVSVRNVLRYRSRLVMMVLGIGGCTALLVTGFGIRDSIASVADDQFGEITLYDYAVMFQQAQTPESAAAYLSKHGLPQERGLLVHSGTVDVAAESGSKSVHLVVSASRTLEGFVSLHSGEETIAYPGPGEAVVNVGLAESLGVARGDVIELRDKDLHTVKVTVSGITDNYVFHYIFVAPETYAQQLGRVPEYNCLYVLGSEGADPFAEGAALLEDRDVGSVTVNEASRIQVDNMLSRLDYIVVVVVLCAAALAFIVLYNLTNINISERVREIATIKVLGFYHNEVVSYVFREIAILSALGSLLGLFMGKALHAFVMAQIQIDAIFFACRVSPLSYGLSLGLTILFTAVIALGMGPRLRRIDMAESLKSIE